MTYSSADIVYGIDLTDRPDSPFAGFEKTIGDLRFDDDLVDGSSNGMGYTAYWVGASMGSIDSTSPDVEGCRLEPTDDDKTTFDTKLKALLDHLDASDDPGARKLAGLVRTAEPKTFLAWGSS